MSTTVKNIIQDLKKIATPARARVSQSFFKTKKGEYGEGDVFIGVTVPQMRVIAGKYKELELKDISTLLKSMVHEHRLVGLFILVSKAKKADERVKQQLAKFYLKHKDHVNNWDLVDSSAEYLLGPILDGKSKSLIYKLSESKNIWHRRIAILTTFHFIKKGEYKDTLKLAARLITDNHDLIHKALGWMLREIGNRDLSVETKFLNKYYNRMPRTMLRYAIEKYPEKARQRYLKK